MKGSHLILALTLASTVISHPLNKHIKRDEGEDPDVADSSSNKNSASNAQPAHVNSDGSNSQQAQQNFNDRFGQQDNGGQGGNNNDGGNDKEGSDDKSKSSDNKSDKSVDKSDSASDVEAMSRSSSFLANAFFEDSFEVPDGPGPLRSYFADGKFDFTQYKADGGVVNGETMMEICLYTDSSLMDTIDESGFGLKFLKQMKPVWNKLAADAGLKELTTLQVYEGAATQSIRNAARDWFGASAPTQAKISTIVVWAVKVGGVSGVSAVIFWLGKLAVDNKDLDEEVDKVFKIATTSDQKGDQKKKRWSDVD